MLMPNSNKTMLKFAAIIVPTTLAMVLGGLFLSRNIVNPLRRLTTVTERLAGRGFSVLRSGETERGDEIDPGPLHPGAARLMLDDTRKEYDFAWFSTTLTFEVLP